ncbi:tetratricopeptide repeat protein [Chitinophaga skermanii]|uniref:Tetratricopeptide repeat protein n=2 Tax=Chitinophaga skermanii TaxID=331697 RepID=A0A327QQP2_9BACT|nr:tetratricopeptide repeat protein [Chitinophaga skermanii]
MVSCNDAPKTASTLQTADTVLQSATIKPITDSIINFPQKHDLYFKRALLLFNDEPHLALQDFEKAAALEPKNPDYLAGAGEAALVTGEYKKAVQHFSTALQLMPNYGYLQYKLAISLIENKELERADSVARILQRDTKVADKGFYLQARIAEEKKDTATAMKLLAAGINHAGIHADYDAIMEMGDLLSDRNSPEAIQYYQLAFQQDTTDTGALHAIAEFHLQRKEMKDAMNMYERAILVDPTDAKAYLKIGDIYMDQKNPAKAVTPYSLAIKGEPSNAEAYYKRGLAYEALHKNDLAKADFEKATIFKKNHEDAVTALKRLAK